MENTRQLVLLCDGTNNNLTGRKSDTHVVLLAEVLRQHPDPQRVVYYDPGVGNSGQLPGTTVVDKFNRFNERLGGLAFGRGVFDNIAEGYGFLMRNWRPWDEIWVFGFSRGAFTARSIAGLVNAFGILDPHLETLVPSLVAAYFSDDSDERKAIRAQISRLFAQGDEPERRPFVHFVGVWDTVASVGLPPFHLRMRTTPNLAGKHFRHVRHALALDEHRAQFKPRAYAENDGPVKLAGGETGSLQQRWFRGSHCDVGGGYHFDASTQARAPFAWMLAEASACGLRLPGAVQPLHEADVLSIIAKLDPPDYPLQPARLGSETWATPLWAITGLAVRDTARAAMDEVPDIPVKMDVHPSASAWAYPFPLSTVWTGHWSWRQWLGIAVALLLALFMPLALGQLLAGGSGWPDLAAACEYLRANLQLQGWQLSLFSSHATWLDQLGTIAHTRGAAAAAIGWDFLFIAAWSFVLAHAVTPAFAFLAGLVAYGRTQPRLVNALGWMLPLALGADIAENTLTLLALGAAGLEWTLVLWPLRALVFAATLAKWLGLAGVSLLLVAGSSNWIRCRLRQRA
jgi:hypothetical protein